jgi:hypothetical protein
LARYSLIPAAAPLGREEREAEMNARTATMVLAGAMVLAMGGAARAQRGPGGGTGPNVNAATAVVVTGEVVSFTAGAGLGTPELVVRQADGSETAFVLGPYPYIQSQGFAAQAGDGVEVTALTCASCTSGYAVIQVTNTTRGVTLVLRSADGTPLWTGPRGSAVRRHLSAGAPMQGRGTGMGAGMGVGQRACGGLGPDMTRAAVLSGVVKGFTGGPGQHMPTLAIATASGETQVLLSPYHALMHAGYTPAVGAQVEVTAAPVVLDGAEHWVAITLRDVATGLQVVLRDAQTGLPVMAGHGWAH